jgi:hypothetical protein
MALLVEVKQHFGDNTERVMAYRQRKVAVDIIEGLCYYFYNLLS